MLRGISRTDLIVSAGGVLPRGQRRAGDNGTSAPQVALDAAGCRFGTVRRDLLSQAAARGT